jgi:hypothetical protein
VLSWAKQRAKSVNCMTRELLVPSSVDSGKGIKV